MRDLKPDNVMLLPGSDGTVASVKLLDFGIAKIRDEQPFAVPLQAVLDSKDGLSTSAGAIMGTPAYMAPEQIKNSSSVDKRADIYAIGIMLYEALAGQRPFSGGSSAKLLGAHLYAEAVPPSVTAKTKGIPARQVAWPKIDAVVLRAIAKEPAQRYQDCAGLQADLEAAWGQSFALVRGAALSGGGASLSASAPVRLPTARRRPMIWVAGLAAVLALAGGGVYWLGISSQHKQQVAAQHNAQAQALFAKAQAGEPAQRRMLMESIEAVGRAGPCAGRRASAGRRRPRGVAGGATSGPFAWAAGRYGAGRAAAAVGRATGRSDCRRPGRGAPAHRRYRSAERADGDASQSNSDPRGAAAGGPGAVPGWSATSAGAAPGPRSRAAGRLPAQSPAARYAGPAGRPARTGGAGPAARGGAELGPQRRPADRGAAGAGSGPAAPRRRQPASTMALRQTVSLQPSMAPRRAVSLQRASFHSRARSCHDL